MRPVNDVLRGPGLLVHGASLPVQIVVELRRRDIPADIPPELRHNIPTPLRLGDGILGSVFCPHNLVEGHALDVDILVVI